MYCVDTRPRRSLAAKGGAVLTGAGEGEVGEEKVVEGVWEVGRCKWVLQRRRLQLHVQVGVQGNEGDVTKWSLCKWESDRSRCPCLQNCRLETRLQVREDNDKGKHHTLKLLTHVFFSCTEVCFTSTGTE